MGMNRMTLVSEIESIKKYFQLRHAVLNRGEEWLIISYFTLIFFRHFSVIKNMPRFYQFP